MKNLLPFQNPNKDLKLRPIVGGPKCPTRRMSRNLDLILKSLIKQIKSSIKDNVEFLKTCKQNVTDVTVLAIFHVCSLYTNIPHEFSLRVVEYFASRQNAKPRFTTKFISGAARYILSNNLMTFDETYYLQIQGTTIDTIFAPTYATLSMGYHKVELYAITRN